MALGALGWRTTSATGFRALGAPGLTEVTPSPTLSTMPAASWPRMQGKSPSGSCADSCQLRAGFTPATGQRHDGTRGHKGRDSPNLLPPPLARSVVSASGHLHPSSRYRLWRHQGAQGEGPAESPGRRRRTASRWLWGSLAAASGRLLAGVVAAKQLDRAGKGRRLSGGGRGVRRGFCTWPLRV